MPYRWSSYIFNPKRPYFDRFINDAMLVDPHIKYGLYLIKGPIYSRSRFIVKSDNEDLRKFIIDQLTRFWLTSANIALDCLDYGYAPSEIMYRYKDGRLHFNKLEPIPPTACRPYVDDGQLTGIGFTTKRSMENMGYKWLNRPKCFWTVHNRKRNRWYGQSRLYGAHLPWYEYNAREGFRDSRQLFYYKNAFSSGTMRYPQGSTTDTNGNQIPNSDVADRLLEQKRNGSGISLPQGTTPENSWDYEPPQVSDLGAGFTEYGRDLKEEMLEGMGVAPEVARAEGTGAYAGRQVPFEAFYSMLQEIINEIITDFEEQILDFLIYSTWGGTPSDYSIEAVSINTEDQQEDKVDMLLANQQKTRQDNPLDPSQQPGAPIKEEGPKLFSYNGLVMGGNLTANSRDFYSPSTITFSTSVVRHAD